MDRFWCFRYLNAGIDLPYMMESSAGCVTAIWLLKIELKELKSSLVERLGCLNDRINLPYMMGSSVGVLMVCAGVHWCLEDIWRPLLASGWCLIGSVGAFYPPLSINNSIMLMILVCVFFFPESLSSVKQIKENFDLFLNYHLYSTFMNS